MIGRFGIPQAGIPQILFTIDELMTLFGDHFGCFQVDYLIETLEAPHGSLKMNRNRTRTRFLKNGKSSRNLIDQN